MNTKQSTGKKNAADKETVLKNIVTEKLTAVIRGDKTASIINTVEKCIEGGISCIEVTFTVPFAHRVIEELAYKFDDSITLGAGTVLDTETARIAMLSGARFIVSPHFNPDIIKMCNRYQVANMAGIMSVTEAIGALEAGTDILKLFPGELFNPSIIKTLNGPLPGARFMPTGGINLDNISQWIAAGAAAVGIGGNLTKGDIVENARAFVNKASVK